jgi:hypothetical protein
MFGLSTKDMLGMSDKQLNQITSLKKLAPYRHDADAGVDYKDKARSQRMAGLGPSKCRYSDLRIYQSTDCKSTLKRLRV